MKARALIACITILAALALLAACQPDSGVAETDSCMECHSGDSITGNAVLAAQAQYDESGHLNGPRMLDPQVIYTDHNYIFHESNAMYTNGMAGPTNCTKCHSHQGFVDFINNGAPDAFYSAASPPGCFTCHKPHISGDFSTRKTTSETLVDGTTVFDGGAGNLCVTCHKSLTSATTFLTGFPKAWTSSNGPHHGPQADFLKGVNHYAYPAKSYVTQSDHRPENIANTCVSCHMYQPGTRLSGSLQMGGHGMYLTADVHGTITNVIGATGGLCRSCHGWSGSGATVAVPAPAAGIGYLTGGFEASTTASLNTRLDAIRDNRDKLITYFSTSANFSVGRPIEPADGSAGAASGEWGKDWVFAAAGATLTQDQSYAFWNFKFFIEDKSEGIHNPDFAHQILYDAVEALALPGGPVGTRP